MKRGLCWLVFAQLAWSGTATRAVRFAPHYSVDGTGPTCNNQPGILLDDANRQIAFKFLADRDMSLQAVDVFLHTNSIGAGTALIATVKTDVSDAPGATVGAATAAFNSPTGTADNWTGQQAFGTSAAVTANTWYWLVFSYGGSGTLDATHYVQAKGNDTLYFENWKMKQSDVGVTSWPTARTADGAFAFRLGDGSYWGFPFTSGAVGSANIAGTAASALRFRIGAGVKVKGVRLTLGKGTNPAALDIQLYDGDTPRGAAVQVPAAAIANNGPFTVLFPAALTVTQGNYGWIVLHQGGADYYRFYTVSVNPAYIGTADSGTWRLATGTWGNAPSTFTMSGTGLPAKVQLLIEDPAADITGGAGTGGGAWTFVQ